MPVVIVKLWEGRTQEQKKELVKTFTEEMSRICKTPPDTITIILEDKKKSDWAEGGTMASEWD